LCGGGKRGDDGRSSGALELRGAWLCDGGELYGGEQACDGELYGGEQACDGEW
jgi:hypothetical protein